MKHAIKGWILLALVVVGFVIVQAGSAEPVLSAEPASLVADVPPPVDLVPAELTLGEASKPMAVCDPLTCFRTCNGRGFCEGECVGTTCRCFIPKRPGGICP